MSLTVIPTEKNNISKNGSPSEIKSKNVYYYLPAVGGKRAKKTGSDTVKKGFDSEKLHTGHA